MRLAKSSQSKLEEFFSEYLDDENFSLPAISFYSGKFTAFLVKLINIEGITIGKRIFIKPQNVTLNSKAKPKLPELLAAHEIVHVLQYQRLGLFRFLAEYLRDYYKNLRLKAKWDLTARHEAYLEIPFEIEARKIADEFVRWNIKNDGK